MEYINETRAPLSDTTKLISWDIVNFYPNCNTKMCIEAINRVLQTYPHIDLKVPTESILEALEITMSSNNTKFEGKFFTQSNGATIEGPESASVTDIFGAIIIDPVAKAGGPFISSDWKRYRDDTWDIEENVQGEQQEEFTRYLNSEVLRDKIKFTVESSGSQLVFLDTKVHLREGFLVPEIYSKTYGLARILKPNLSTPSTSVKKQSLFGCS